MHQIGEFFYNILDSSDWPPRWHCGRWTEFHGWLYIISDLLIWSAYFTIPLVILKYLSRRHDLKFVKLYFLFAAFILACGSTHLLDALAFWVPVYRLNALVRLVTGILSWLTVYYLIKLLPFAFSMKSQHQLESEIAQRENAEELIRQSMNHIESIFGAAPDAVIVIDERGKVVNWNARAQQLFGWSFIEAVDVPLSQLIIPARYREQHRVGMDHYLATGESKVLGKTIEIQAINKEGIEFYVALSISPTYANNRQLFIAFLRDITEENRRKQQIIELNSDLEKRVLKRTEELRQLNEELEDRVSRRTIQLESANKEMEAFTYSVSHDLRAPLRGISGFITMLEQRLGPAPEPEILRITGVIVKNTLKMSRLIDDLLAFSKMARQEMLLKPINSTAVVREIIGEVTPRETDVCWEMGALPDVMADMTAIRQVWINLLSNAVKYSSKEPAPRIEIGSYPEQGQTVFYIKDNGVGFDNKYRDKLFNVFQRLHSVDQFEGTGVGLAIVSKIISKHGGKVWADAEAGKGATFFFSLPGRKWRGAF